MEGPNNERTTDQRGSAWLSQQEDLCPATSHLSKPLKKLGRITVTPHLDPVNPGECHGNLLHKKKIGRISFFQCYAPFFLVG